uniref:Synapse defective Rho GTPase homolog 1 n=1 Tax=Amazona collaria TaxID=241587 RepID=A0A8B9G6J7_9PSIT
MVLEWWHWDFGISSQLFPFLPQIIPLPALIPRRIPKQHPRIRCRPHPGGRIGPVSPAEAGMRSSRFLPKLPKMRWTAESRILPVALSIPGRPPWSLRRKRRNPGHGAYLQSLERSSRHWVLSSMKIPGSDEPGAGAEVDPGAAGSEGDIWYNPIPEDEDLQAGTPPPILSPTHPFPLGTGKAPTPPSPPASPPKSRALQKVKSPGTVRRLSMKMKKLPELRRKLSLRNPRSRGPEEGPSPSERKESSNVISRYHLDTSVASPRAKATTRGGYLSDGDSPELPMKAKPPFHPYSSGEMPPRCGQRISGLVSVHLHGVKDLKPPRGDGREVFCVLQVDAANRARTALLACKTGFLGLNHTFNLELEGAQHLKVMVFSWDAASCRNRLCCHGTVVLPHIFRGCRAQQLAVRLQPRGVLYSKFTLVERWDGPSEPEPRVFGVELSKLVEREKTATKVPLIIQKCVAEIEKRGLKVVGLYRLCGSAAVKKELRDAFERDSAAVTLSEHLYPDINVITGILKDYLRELPTPLITPALHHVVLEAMAKRPPRGHRDAVTLLECLPDVEKVGAERQRGAQCPKGGAQHPKGGPNTKNGGHNIKKWVPNTKKWVPNTKKWVPNIKKWVHNTKKWVHSIKKWVHNTQKWVPNTKKWVPNTQKWVPNIKRWVPNTQKWVPNINKWVPNINNWVPNVKKWVPHVKKWAPNTQKWVPNINKWVPNIKKWVPNTQKWVPNIKKWVPNIKKWVPNTQKWGPNIEKWAPNTQKWVPSTQKWVHNIKKWVPNTKKWVPSTQKWVPSTPKCVPSTTKCVPITHKCVPITRKCSHHP